MYGIVFTHLQKLSIVNVWLSSSNPPYSSWVYYDWLYTLIFYKSNIICVCVFYVSKTDGWIWFYLKISQRAKMQTTPCLNFHHTSLKHANNLILRFCCKVVWVYTISKHRNVYTFTSLNCKSKTILWLWANAFFSPVNFKRIYLWFKYNAVLQRKHSNQQTKNVKCHQYAKYDAICTSALKSFQIRKNLINKRLRLTIFASSTYFFS